ncbi:MAG: hypothetical protein J6W18_06675 [Bacteroidaceae bacterium]|nr:hypothetical protein [Bacteroidaceae bacterium]
MNKTEDILERLKGQMPQVPDSDFLTQSIMSAVTAKPGKIIPMWFKVLRVVSSTAAVFLIGLFIGLNSQKPVSTVETAAVPMEVRQPVSRPAIKDKNDAIQVYKERMERRKQRQLRQTRIENLYAKI